MATMHTTFYTPIRISTAHLPESSSSFLKEYLNLTCTINRKKFRLNPGDSTYLFSTVIKIELPQ